MRAFRKSWIGIGLAILFAASLFFFRGSTRYSNLFNSDNFVADISGTPISTTKFLRSMDMNIDQFSQMIGSPLTGDQIRSFQVHQIALQNLVNRAVFENEFDKINFILDDTTIAKETKINDKTAAKLFDSYNPYIGRISRRVEYLVITNCFRYTIIKKNKSVKAKNSPIDSALAENPLQVFPSIEAREFIPLLFCPKTIKLKKLAIGKAAPSKPKITIKFAEIKRL